MLERAGATSLSHAYASLRYVDDMTTLADRINQIMQETGYTLQQLGDMAGVTLQAVAQWRTGQTSNIRMENLFRLADRCGYSARWIATGEGPRFPAAEKDPRCLLDIEELSEDQRAIIRAVVDASKKQERKCG